MTNDIADGNGKVTMAVLGSKLDEVLRRMDRFDACTDRHDGRLSLLEQGQSARINQIATLRADVDALEKKSETWSVLNSIGALVAGVLAAFSINR